MIFPTPPLRRTEDFQRNAHGCMVYIERAGDGSSFMWHQPCHTQSSASTASFLIFPPLEGCFGFWGLKSLTPPIFNCLFSLMSSDLTRRRDQINSVWKRHKTWRVPWLILQGTIEFNGLYDNDIFVRISWRRRWNNLPQCTGICCLQINFSRKAGCWVCQF